MSSSDSAPDRLRSIFSKVEPVQESPDDHAHYPAPRRPELGRHIRCWTPRTSSIVRCLGADQRGYELLLHRLDNKPVPCLKPLRYCYGCKAGAPARWCGYVGVQILATREPKVLEITPGAAKCCPEFFTHIGYMYRRVISVARQRPDVRSPMALAVGQVHPTAAVTCPVNGLAVLERVFQLPQAELLLLSNEAARNRP